MENKKKNAINVFAIIVNWNGKDDTEVCLSSLAKVKKQGSTLTVVVIDNGSTNDSVASFRKHFPRVTVIETGKNLGFTGGNNVGMNYALEHGADIIWLLNNDTFVDPNVLSFVHAFKDPHVGICGSKIYFSPGHEFHHDRYMEKDRGHVIWYAGGVIDWDNVYASHRGVDEVDHGQYDRVEETPFITGCSMAISREVLTRIGRLDDRYYLYLEDLDLCLRAQRAGYKLLYVPSSMLWHVNAGSSSRPGNPLHEYYFTRNRILLGFRYARMRTKVALFREAVRFLFTGSSVRRKAVIDAFFGRFGNRFSLAK